MFSLVHCCSDNWHKRPIAQPVQGQSSVRPLRLGGTTDVSLNARIPIFYAQDDEVDLIG